MFLKKIDLLSAGPQIFIFNKDSNKTVFGGSLFLIYLIIVLLIGVAYLIDYILNDKYDVQYGIHQELLTEAKQNELLENSEYNPKLEISFNLTDLYNIELSDRFVIWDDISEKFIARGERISTNVAKLSLAILYKCEDERCLINDEDYSPIGYELILNYSGYKLDHQGNIPLYKPGNLFYLHNSVFFFNKPMIQYFQWGVMRYYQEKNFLDTLNDLFGEEDNILIGGYFINSYNYLVDGIIDKNLEYSYIDGNWYKLLVANYAQVEFFKFEEYKRTKRSIMDVFADVSALSMTVLKIIAFVFSYFYSGNFDNYKIIEKVLSKEKKSNKLINGKIKDITDKTRNDDIKLIELNDNSGKSEALLENDKEEKIQTIKEMEDNEKIKVKDDKDRVIPKLTFIDFMLNKVYFEKCCKASNRQKLISSCNNIVSKYYTIEDIIYNQMKLENLLKDYKWNDPKLKNINNNELIINLQNYYEI